MIRDLSIKSLDRGFGVFGLPFCCDQNPIQLFKRLVRQIIGQSKLSTRKIQFSKVVCINNCIEEERPSIIKLTFALLLGSSQNIKIPTYQRR